jgi:hypothetical protein
MPNFPLPRCVIERVPDPEHNTFGVFHQFDRKITDRGL